MSENKRAAFLNLGCKVNEYETERLKERFLAAGYEIVLFSEQADVYVINTCTVTAEADRKSRQMIRRARNKSNDAVIVCAGCFSESAVKKQGENAVYEETGADIIVGNGAKSDIIALVEEYRKTKKKKTYIPDIAEKGISYEKTDISCASLENAENEAVCESRTRAFLKIEDGCDRFCSYCLIPFARGRARSRRLSDIIREGERFFLSGRREIVLTGINLSSYKGDNGEDLISVTEALSERLSKLSKNGAFRIRLGSLEPDMITEGAAKRLSGIRGLCPHFHLSIQSGSTTVLSRMNRHYTADDVTSAIALLRKYFDDPAITTDIIAGFPGETEEEFEETYEFAKKSRLSAMHVFPYSKREGTKAAGLPGQIKKSEKLYRTGRLIELGKELKKDHIKNNSGKKVSVLIEEEIVENDLHYFQGYSENYIRTLILKSEKTDGIYEGAIVSGEAHASPDNDCLIIDKDFIIL